MAGAMGKVRTLASDRQRSGIRWCCARWGVRTRLRLPGAVHLFYQQVRVKVHTLRVEVLSMVTEQGMVEERTRSRRYGRRRRKRTRERETRARSLAAAGQGNDPWTRVRVICRACKPRAPRCAARAAPRRARRAHASPPPRCSLPPSPRTAQSQGAPAARARHRTTRRDAPHPAAGEGERGASAARTCGLASSSKYWFKDWCAHSPRGARGDPVPIPLPSSIRSASRRRPHEERGAQEDRGGPVSPACLERWQRRGQRRARRSP